MKDYEFYREYANLPLEIRLKTVDFQFGDTKGSITLSDIYHEVKRIDDAIRPQVIEKERLIGLFEDELVKHL